MNMYAVFTENSADNISEMWLTMADTEEEAKAKAVAEGESSHIGKYTATKIVFLREACLNDAEMLEGLNAHYLYSWERE